MAVKQTAGRDSLGTFAPKFAALNDDVLFGEVWSREDKLSLRDRSLVTVVSLMAMGLVDESFRYHLQTAKANGITKEEIAEIVTHAAFYVGWPKAWRCSVWQKKSGPRKRLLTTPKHSMQLLWSFQSAPQTMLMPNTSSAKVIWRRSLATRFLLPTSPLNLAAATIGTFTMPTKVVDKCSSASLAVAIIRNGAKNRCL